MTTSLETINQSSIVGTIVSIAKNIGVDPRLAVVTAFYESGFDPQAVGDHGTSFGLFQLHQGGELGSLTQQQAFDPTTNANRALSTMAQVQAKNPGATAGAIAAAAQRPQNPDQYAKNINGLYTASAFSSIPGDLSTGGASTIQVGSTQVTIPGVGGGPSSAGSQLSGDEGYLFQFHIPGDGDAQMKRATARKIVGAITMIGGGVLILAGVFRLSGRKTNVFGGALGGAISGSVGGPAGVAAGAATGGARGAVPSKRKGSAVKEGAAKRRTLKSQAGAAEGREATKEANRPESKSRAATEAGRRAAEKSGPFGAADIKPGSGASRTPAARRKATAGARR